MKIYLVHDLLWLPKYNEYFTSLYKSIKGKKFDSIEEESYIKMLVYFKSLSDKTNLLCFENVKRAFKEIFRMAFKLVISFPFQNSSIDFEILKH